MKVEFFKSWGIYFVGTLMLSVFCVGVVSAALNNLLEGYRLSEETMSSIGLAIGFLIGMVASFVMYRWTIKSFIFPQVDSIDLTKDLEEE